MTPEGKVKHEIERYLKTLLPDIWYYKAQDKFTSGVPDFVCCYKSVFIGIEVKKPGLSLRNRKRETLQQIIGRKIDVAGGLFLITDNVSDVATMIESEFD